MGVVEPAGTVPGYDLNPADHARVTLDILEDRVDERQQLKDMQSPSSTSLRTPQPTG